MHSRSDVLALETEVYRTSTKCALFSNLRDAPFFLPKVNVKKGEMERGNLTEMNIETGKRGRGFALPSILVAQVSNSCKVCPEAHINEEARAFSEEEAAPGAFSEEAATPGAFSEEAKESPGAGLEDAAPHVTYDMAIVTPKISNAYLLKLQRQLEAAGTGACVGTAVG